jgi:hypothetical protein
MGKDDKIEEVEESGCVLHEPNSHCLCEAGREAKEKCAHRAAERAAEDYRAEADTVLGVTGAEELEGVVGRGFCGS